MKLIRDIKRKLFCSKGNHEFEHVTAGNRVVEIDGNRYFADIPMRHCKNCERSEEKWFDNKWRRWNRDK